MYTGFNHFEKLPDEKDTEISALKLLLKENKNKILELKKKVRKYKGIDCKGTVEDQLEVKVVDDVEQCICKKQNPKAKCDPYILLTVSQQQVMEHEVYQFMLAGSDLSEEKRFGPLSHRGTL